MEANPAVALLLHECKCKLAARSAQAFQCFHQRRNDICRQIHQESFSDPERSLSWIEAAFDQSFSVESSGVEVNRDKMQSFIGNFRKGAHFVALRRRMIYFPKSHASEALM